MIMDRRNTLMARSKFIGLLLAGAAVLPGQALAAGAPANSASVEQQLAELRAMRQDMQRQMAEFDAKISTLENELHPGGPAISSGTPAAGVSASGSESAPATATATAQYKAQSNTEFEVYGFAQVDAMTDLNGRMKSDWMDAFRPSRIATPEGQYGSDGQTSFSVKQSRLGAKASGEAGGKTWEGKFEFDMFGVGGDAGQTTIRLRHAYGRWGPILGGQTNSLFMDGNIFPNVIDYWGPAGMVFLRTPQLRLTLVDKDGLTAAVAFEHASNDVDTGNIRLIDENLGSSITGKDELPDFTAAIGYSQDWGHVRLGGIMRKISYETPGELDAEPKGHETGWGLNATGSFKLGDMATFRGGVVYGQGIASYMNDGGMDLAPSVSPVAVPPIFPAPSASQYLVVEAKAVKLLGISAYMDFNWNSQLTSSLGYSQTEVDNTNFQTPDTFKKGQYASANLLWSPIPRVLTGGEVLWGQRTNFDGTKGKDLRMQFSFKVSFSSNDLKN